MLQHRSSVGRVVSVTQCWVMLAVFRRNHRWRRGRLLRYYQAVFLSPRTVDMHVHNILTKLDCRSRTEATDRAVELGLLERRP